ncbi:MAG: hypothetical protein KF902_01510 [Phycisphaeraceae bacterium]|nr:hypothetical protein [Phycisphaeraceae bacterium]
MKSSVNKAPPPDPLATYLADRDVRCPSCGYNLRNLASSNCPQCGTSLSPHLCTDAARDRRRSFCTIMLSIPLGTFATVLLFDLALVLNGSVFRVSGNQHLWALVAYPATMACVFAALLAALLSPRGKRWFQQLTDPRCTFLTIAVGIGSLASISAWITWLWIIHV